MTKTYKLSNGEIADLTGIPEAEQFAAIRELEESIASNGLGSENNQATKSNGRMALDKFHDALRNMGAGASESFYNAADALRPALSLRNPKFLEKNQRPDFQKAFGVQNRNEAIQKIPEMAASFIPGFGAGKALSKAPAIARGLGTAAEQVVTQGGLGYLFNPESRMESAGKAGGLAGAMQLALSGLTSNNPIARIGRYLGPRLAGGYAGEKGAEFAGLPMPARVAAGIAGWGLGGAGASIIPKILGTKSMAQKNYAQDIIDATKSANQRELQVAQAASKRHGAQLTPGELTQDPVLLAKEAAAGKTKANVRLKNSLEEARNAKEARINEEFKSGVYSPSKHAKAEEKAFAIASPTMVPKGVVPKEHEQTYARAKKFAQNNHNFAAALAKAKKGSIGEHDVVRQALDKMIKSETGSTSNLEEAREALSQSLKKYSPDYKAAMMYAERGHVANEIEKLADKKNLNGKTFFKYIEGDKALNNAIKHTRDVPGAKQFLKDAKRIYSRRKDVDVEKLAKSLTDSNIPTSKSDVKNLLSRLFDGKGDKDVIKMMYDPDIMSKVHSIAGMNNSEKMISEFAKVLARATSQQAARTDKKGK